MTHHQPPPSSTVVHRSQPPFPRASTPFHAARRSLRSSSAFVRQGAAHERSYQTDVHVVANGDYAYANGSVADESGGMAVFSLYVWRTGSREDPGAFISYDVGRCDALLNCAIVESGDGEIPRGDLTGRAAGGLHLETNTATNLDVVKDGPGGLIVIDWKKTGDWTVFYSGTQVHRSPGHTWRQQGTTTDHSAVASGQALGIPAAGGYAQFGTSHEVQLEVGRETIGLPMLDARLTSSPDATLNSSPTGISRAAERAGCTCAPTPPGSPISPKPVRVG
jgi:hypothetical protein